MESDRRSERLSEAASRARAAEERGDPWAVNEAWNRYELIRDGGRAPAELLAEAIALSDQVVELAKRLARRPATPPAPPRTS